MTSVKVTCDVAFWQLGSMVKFAFNIIYWHRSMAELYFRLGPNHFYLHLSYTNYIRIFNRLYEVKSAAYSCCWCV